MNISYVAVEGHRIAVDVRGSGPLVVCSPAMGDTRDAFVPLADRLVQRGFRVALLDLRGHGDSDAGFSRYGDEATADDLLAVINELADGPVYLAGASMSAASAVIAAGRRPDLVAGLVLLGPFLRNGAGAVAEAAFRIALSRPWGPAVWRLYAATLWPGLGKNGARARAAHTARSLTRPGRWAAFQLTARTDHSVVEPWISHVTAPSLVVMGEADPDWKDPASEANWVAGQLGSDVLMVPAVGHAPMLEAPEVVADRVIEFLTGAVDASRRA
ncbi:pimeloyl-ACP methyl ester carboxylesterase [Okibacterium sp. HSC-33S16]|uniref:alpha/beta fold hydrolase n=1 Tax=Okibacterium sp. HSC-33S16 TaxID=2910965 RepID=UPI0020A0185F|nr:alpha/beta hydrolase [Okibacterium sp. HSC-33S16]MCP2032491.1 pimeloyl-ACP methyl ester carboxylesterase [Okibacterium sp. HSC-33S16]